MSAEPAHTGPGGTTPATVILMHRRTTPTRHPHHRDAAPTGNDRAAGTLHHRFANRLEQAYLRHSRTLTDPETAEAYRIAVDAFAELLEGARVTGLVDETAYSELHAMIESMQHAPDLVENA